MTDYSLPLDAVLGAAILTEKDDPVLSKALLDAVEAEANSGKCREIRSRLRDLLAQSHFITLETDQSAIDAAAIRLARGAARSAVIGDPRRQNAIGYISASRGDISHQWGLTYIDFASKYPQTDTEAMSSRLSLTRDEVLNLRNMTERQPTVKLDISHPNELCLLLENVAGVRFLQNATAKSRLADLCRVSESNGSVTMSRICSGRLMTGIKDSVKFPLESTALMELAAASAGNQGLALVLCPENTPSSGGGRKKKKKKKQTQPPPAPLKPITESDAVIFSAPQMSSPDTPAPAWIKTALRFRSPAVPAPVSVRVPEKTALAAVARFWWLADGHPMCLRATAAVTKSEV